MAARKATAAPAPLVRPVTQDAKMSFIECHAEGHTWVRVKGWIDPSEAEPGVRPAYHQHSPRGRRANCSSCGSYRLRWYGTDGTVVPKYHYTDGYLHKRSDPDDVAPTKLEWRRTLVTTLFDDVVVTPSKRQAS